MKSKSTLVKNYSFSLILILAIGAGSLLGYLFGPRATFFKPFGDVFLNLLFTIVVPMVFFALSSAVAIMTDVKRLGKILGAMFVVFVGAGILAAVIMMAAVRLYPPAKNVSLDSLKLPVTAAPERSSVADQLVRTFTVSDFGEVLSKKNMLALIFFSILIGLAASSSGEKGKPFVQFLTSGSAVTAKALSYIMLYAPIGLGAYFAYLIGAFGPQLLGPYLRAMILYYPMALGYYLVVFSFYAFLAGRTHGVRAFWSNIIPASLTAWATGSSVATIPMNLAAAERIGVPRDIREMVIPIGTQAHMDGSCLAAVLKMALLFGLFKINIVGFDANLKALGVALLCGVVVSGIPGGGLLGELMIITLYGFPIEALPLITMVGTLVDPPATMLNAIGDNVASMMVARILEGKHWMRKRPVPVAAAVRSETVLSVAGADMA